MCTVFERVGGFAAVRPVVAEFYDRILESPRLSRHFAGVDMRRMVDHQTKFMAQVMGGPATFSMPALTRAHERLAITRDEFQEMLALLREALEDGGLAADDVTEVGRNMAAYESCIVTARAPAEAAR